MSTTYASILPTLTDLDLKLKSLDATERLKVKAGDESVSPNGLVKTCLYTYDSGLGTDLVTWLVRRSYDPKTDTTSVSWKITYNMRKTVSETGEVTDTPMEAGSFWNYRGKNLPSFAPMNEGIQTAFAVLFFALTGANGTPTTAPVSSIDRGVLNYLIT